jgi:hypothetical protein
MPAQACGSSLPTNLMMLMQERKSKPRELCKKWNSAGQPATRYSLIAPLRGSATLRLEYSLFFIHARPAVRARADFCAVLTRIYGKIHGGSEKIKRTTPAEDFHITSSDG